jgi:hypothetical protein
MLSKVIALVVFWLQPFYYATGRVGAWVKGYALYVTAVVLGSWYASSRWGIAGLASLVAGAEVLFTLCMLTLAFAQGERDNEFESVRLPQPR